MNTTEPYSPMPASNASVKPVSSAGSTAGRMMRRNTCHARAPSVSAAFLEVALHLDERRLHGTHDEGQARSDQRDHDPEPGVATCTPASASFCPSHPTGRTPRERDARDRRPACERRSMKASTSRRPGKSSGPADHATMKPNTR